MTDLETAIMIKNMAREMVKRASVKNAMQFKYGDKVTVDGKYEGVVQAVKDGYYEVRIFDGSRVVGTKVVWPNNITARNTAKNAALTVKRDFVWSRSFASGPASMREVKIKAGAPVEKSNGTYFVKPSYFSGDSILQHDATHYGCRVQPDNVEGI